MSQGPINVPPEDVAAPQNLTLQLEQERRTVSFDSYDIAVRQLLEMVTENAIDIAPEYQRKFVWDTQRQSEFIESVFLGIPIPSLFMATNKDSSWEVVDGVQRISTLIHFCGSEDVALPEGIIRGGRRITPFNLYEAISVGTALVFAAGRQPSADLLRGLLNNEELRELTSGGTNSRKRVTSRIEFVRDSI